MEIKKAFITLLSTEDYLDAVLVLKKSMEAVHTSYPLVCAVTEDIYSENIIRTLVINNIYPEKIRKLEYSSELQSYWKGLPVLNTASKISLFDLKHYDKLCYIDADTFLLQNIDEVLDRLDGSMIEPNPEEREDNFGFTGLFVFQPRYHETDFYKCIMQNFKCADGDLLGKLWFFTRTSPLHRIPCIYCMQYTYAKMHNLFPTQKNLQSKETPKVIHFCNKEKPWMKEYRNFFLERNPIINLYFKLLEKIRASIN